MSHVDSSVHNAVREVCYLSMEVPWVPPSTIYMTEPVIDISYVFRVGTSELNYYLLTLKEPYKYLWRAHRVPNSR